MHQYTEVQHQFFLLHGKLAVHHCHKLLKEIQLFYTGDNSGDLKSETDMLGINYHVRYDLTC